MKTGGSTVLKLSLRNDSTDDISVKLSSTMNGNNPSTVEFSANDFTLSKGNTKTVDVTYSCDRYATHGDYTSSIDVTAFNYGTMKSGTASLQIMNNITSEYVSNSSFNKIMCIFDNNLPAPFNGPETSAAITGLIWLLIAALSVVIIKLIANRLLKGGKEESHDITKKTGAMIFLVIFLHGIIETLTVYGANEQLVLVLSDITEFTNIIMLAYVSWNIYKNVVKYIFHRMEKSDKIDVADTSLIPLFNMIGELVIILVAAMMIMNRLGYDLIGLLAGAGIIGLALSIGSQNLISQFFGGLVLLITRPFKMGDMVRIDNSSDIYEVKKVGLMNTTLKNWNSLEMVTMPNNNVSSAKITNITADTKAYRIFMYYSVDFESDFDLVRKSLIETAMNHPKVITDGTYSRPDVRVNSFQSTAVEVRLAVYINDFRDNIEVSDELYTQGIKDLEMNGVNIPYEKRDVLLVYPE